MTDDSEAGISFPATVGTGNGLAPGSEVASKGSTEEIVGGDEKELSTVAKRFLIAEINRLVEENRQLKQFKDKYHDIDKKLAIFKETSKPFRANEFLSSICLITGSAGLGAASSFLSLNSYGWYVFVGASALLTIAGIAARFHSPATANPSRH
jgi:hypothetical protein